MSDIQFAQPDAIMTDLIQRIPGAPGIIAAPQEKTLAEKIKENPAAYDFSDIPLGDSPSEQDFDKSLFTLADAIGGYRHIKGKVYAQSPTIEAELAFMDWEEQNRNRDASEPVNARQQILQAVALAAKLFVVLDGESFRPITPAEVSKTFGTQSLIAAIQEFVGYTYGGQDPNSPAP